MLPDNSPQQPDCPGAGSTHCCTKTSQTEKNQWILCCLAYDYCSGVLEGRPADASALPWRTKLATASSTPIGSVRLVPLPTGFLVGISLVLGVISGGSVAAVLMPEQQETNLDP